MTDISKSNQNKVKESKPNFLERKIKPLIDNTLRNIFGWEGTITTENFAQATLTFLFIFFNALVLQRLPQIIHYDAKNWFPLLSFTVALIFVLILGSLMCISWYMIQKERLSKQKAYEEALIQQKETEAKIENNRLRTEQALRGFITTLEKSSDTPMVQLERATRVIADFLDSTNYRQLHDKLIKKIEEYQTRLQEYQLTTTQLENKLENEKIARQALTNEIRNLERQIILLATNENINGKYNESQRIYPLSHKERDTT